MKWLGDSTLNHLRSVADLPDLSDTRYRVVHELARGGMGTVYVADDVELQRRVALKVLNAVEPDRDAADRMMREARIIARLEHPGIVPVHDVGILPDGRIFYVMKLIRGERLDTHFDASATIPDRLRIFERVCEAVSFAHAHGVIHRDLKPQNIMVGPFGEVLLLDWGVAKVLAEPPEQIESADDLERSTGTAEGATIAGDWDPNRTQSLHTAYGTIVGTPAYMAPEQARGEIDRINERTDVFALGAILYFLLAGRAPLGRTGFEHARRAEMPPVERPRISNRSVPRPLDSICLKALAPESNDRYVSAEELGSDIARFLAGRSVAAHRESVMERAMRLAWKYRTPIVLVVAYLIVRISLIFWGRG